MTTNNPVKISIDYSINPQDRKDLSAYLKVSIPVDLNTDLMAPQYIDEDLEIFNQSLNPQWGSLDGDRNYRFIMIEFKGSNWSELEDKVIEAKSSCEITLHELVTDYNNLLNSKPKTYETEYIQDQFLGKASVTFNHNAIVLAN